MNYFVSKKTHFFASVSCPFENHGNLSRLFIFAILLTRIKSRDFSKIK